MCAVLTNLSAMESVLVGEGDKKQNTVVPP